MTSGPRVSTVLVAVDTRARDLSRADHVAHELDHVLGDVLADPPALATYVVTTHVVAGDGQHVAVAASWSGAVEPGVLLDALVVAFPGAGVVVGDAVAGPDDLVQGARVALAAHADRSSGRLARFPGQHEIERRLTVAEVLAASCVDEVTALSGTDIGPASELDLTGFVRPTWKDGRCSVLVQPAVQGLIPFEVRDQIACCSDH